MSTPSDLVFFATLMKAGSLSAAAREFDVTPSAASKWLQQLEERLGIRLANRTTRRISLTSEGEVYLTEGRRILAEIEELDQTITSSRAAPKGLLRIECLTRFRPHLRPQLFLCLPGNIPNWKCNCYSPTDR